MTTTTNIKRLTVGMTIYGPSARIGTVAEISGSMARIEWTRNPAEKWLPTAILSAPGWGVVP